MKFLSVLALGASSVLQAHALPQHTPDSVLYFLDSDPSGASIVAVPIDRSSGKLGSPVKTSTGGAGLISNNAMGQVTVDPIFSQDSVVVHGSDLFTVNPGSNTLARFYIAAHDPLHPTLLGAPVATAGDVPNTLAYSPRHNLVCVANTGPIAGLECFTASSCGSLTPQGSLRPLPVNQTATPLGPAGTTSDVLFNPDETAVFVMVKGDGTNPGYIYVYPIDEHGVVSETPVVSRPPGLLLPFGTAWTSSCTAVVTDPAYGASLIAVESDWTVSVTHKVTIAGQAAACWTRVSPEFDAAYILDGGNSSIVTLDPFSGETKYVISGLAAGMGNFDGVVDGDYLYALQATAEIASIDLQASGRSKPHVAYTLDLSSVGSRAGFTGLALWTKAW